MMVSKTYVSALVSEVVASTKAMSAAEAVTKAMAATAMSAAKAMSTAMSSMGSCQRSANWKYQRCNHGGGDSQIFLSLHKRLQISLSLSGMIIHSSPACYLGFTNITRLCF